jgi:adenine deaminase
LRCRGFALHEELGLLAEAGLSLAAALRTATWNPVEFFACEPGLRFSRTGEVAYLVVLDANPLIAIVNTTRIQAVLRKGHLLVSNALHSMLERVRTEVASNANMPGRLQRRESWVAEFESMRHLLQDRLYHYQWTWLLPENDPASFPIPANPY